MNACPRRLANTRYTATWRSRSGPAVPVYWRCTPTVALPFFRSPVSSATSTAPPVAGRPGAPRRSRAGRPGRRPRPNGPGQQMLQAVRAGMAGVLGQRPAVPHPASSASSPNRNEPACTRGSRRANRGPIRIITSDSSACHRSTSTLAAAATARSSRVHTTRDHQAVAAPRPGPTHPKITKSGSSTSGRRPARPLALVVTAAVRLVGLGTGRGTGLSRRSHRPTGGPAESEPCPGRPTLRQSTRSFDLATWTRGGTCISGVSWTPTRLDTWSSGDLDGKRSPGPAWWARG